MDEIRSTLQRLKRQFEKLNGDQKIVAPSRHQSRSKRRSSHSSDVNPLIALPGSRQPPCHIARFELDRLRGDRRDRIFMNFRQKVHQFLAYHVRAQHQPGSALYFDDNNRFRGISNNGVVSCCHVMFNFRSTVLI